MSNSGNERTENDKMPSTENTVGSMITSLDQTEDQIETSKSKQESTDIENLNESMVGSFGQETDHLVTTLNGRESTDLMSDTVCIQYTHGVSIKN